MQIKGMTKGLILLLGLGVAVMMGTRFNDSADDPKIDYPLSMAEIRDIEVKVRTVGLLDAARSYMVSSTVRGDKGKIIYLIEDGSHVNQGDVLVRLDPTPFEENISRLTEEKQNLEAAVEAERQVFEWEKTQAEKEIKTAEFNVRVAQLEYQRLVEGEGPIQLTQYKTEVEKTQQELEKYSAYIEDLKQLASKGFSNIGEMTLARKKLAELKEKRKAAESKYDSYQNHVFPSLRETALARIEKAKMEIEQTRNGSVYQIAKAAAALKKSERSLAGKRAALKRAEKELKKTEIRAPLRGIAILFEAFRNGQKRKPRVGDKVWQNQPLLYLPDISAMIVKTQVREIDLHKIFLGQHCVVRVDAYPDVSFKGKVSFIGILATGRYQGGGSEKYFQVTVAIPTEDPRLRPGMTARAEIFGRHVKNALSVPVQAVFHDNREVYCYRFDGTGFEKRNIKIGCQTEDIVQVLSGIKEGDRISLVRPAPETIHE